MTTRVLPSIAYLYPCKAGHGGWGIHASSIVRDLASHFRLTAIGPGFSPSWALGTEEARSAKWIELSTRRPLSLLTRIQSRFAPGRVAFNEFRRFGESAAALVKEASPQAIYTFSHIGLESLEWANKRSIPSFLDVPNTHIRDHREAYVEQSRRYGCGTYRGAPTQCMVDRIRREYELASHIRVSSHLSKRSLIAHGVTADKIGVIPLPVDLESFRPMPRQRPDGPLQVSFVGSLDLRKGFIPLLRAVRGIGTTSIKLRMVGNTGNSCDRQLLAREREGLHVSLEPGDPRPVYTWSEVFVLPSLEDGFGYVVPEAMASGLPVIVTDRCGAAEWVKPGETGWIVQAGDVNSLSNALRDAIERRKELPIMGDAARRSVEDISARRLPDALANWITERLAR